MIRECVKAKFVDPTYTSYRPREILRDMQGEFGVSFNYLRAWRGKEAALNSLRGDDAQSYQGNFIVIMLNYYVIVLLMVGNLHATYVLVD